MDKFALLFLFVGVASQEVGEERPAIVHNVPKGDANGEILVKEFVIDASVDTIEWCGRSNQIVFVRSSLGTVYRSTTFGKIWEQQMDKLRGSLVPEKDGRKGIAQVIVSPADPNYLFFQGYGETHWITRDGGDTYDLLSGVFPVKQLSLHPSEPEWVLASKWSSGCKKLEAMQNCSVETHLSTDFGRTWSYLDSYVVQFGWGRKHIPEEILMVKYAEPGGNQRFGAWDKNAHMFRSTDLWKTNTKLIPHGNRFLLQGGYLFVAAVHPDKANQVQFAVAKDDSMVYELGRLPFEIREHSYTVLDTSEGAVFVHVNHGEFQTPYGNIYLSDADGWRYSLSLRYNRRDMRGRCDFEKVKGLDGVYIANLIDNPDSFETPGEREHIVTVMTFDKGARWGRIKAPQHDVTGQDTQCSIDQGCSLHLHGITGEWGPFYSTQSALGLILATGNTGAFLDLSSAGGNVNTYFSRDAGQTWFEVRKGSHVYEIGDHGGLLVMAKDREPTKEVLYSWNEGISWKTLPLPDSTDVDNIVTQPNATTTRFVVLGSRGGVGVLTYLDFSNLHVKKCEGIEAAGRPQSAFELWTPTDGTSKCLLGRQVQYTRRKRAEECFNGEDYERQTFVSNCPCAEHDYECDVGFERQGLDGPCIALRAISADVPKNCPPGGRYTIPNGYRRIAGDTCDADAGLNRLPTQLRCPGILSVVGFSWSLLFVIALVLLAIFGLVYLNKNPHSTYQITQFFRKLPSATYSRIPLNPENFSDGDLSEGEGLLEEAQPDVDAFADELDTRYGPLPPPSSDFSEMLIPTILPPPSSNDNTDDKA